MTQAIPTSGRVAGSVLRQIRQDQGGLSQEEAARVIRGAGKLPWTRVHVAALETGRRDFIGLDELAALSVAFNVPPASWFPGKGWIRFGETTLLDVEWLRSLLSSKPPRRPAAAKTDYIRPIDRGVGPEFLDLNYSFKLEDPFSEAEQYAARQLRAKPAAIRAAALHIWDGRRLDERRDSLLAEQPESEGSVRVRRGRITQALLAELRQELKRRQVDRSAMRRRTK